MKSHYCVARTFFPIAYSKFKYTTGDLSCLEAKGIRYYDEVDLFKNRENKQRYELNIKMFDSNAQRNITDQAYNYWTNI